MYRKVQHIRLIQKDALRSISVMHVPIANQHTLDSQFLACVRRRNGHVVNDAVATGKPGFRVMTGWTNDGKSIVQVTLHNSGH
jgi:hypothetical protein